VDLTGQADVWSKANLYGKAIPFQFTDLTRIAICNFDSAGCTAGVTPASVKDINTCILEYENELAPVFGIDYLRTCSCVSLDLWHNFTPTNC